MLFVNCDLHGVYAMSPIACRQWGFFFALALILGWSII